jgi:3D (Asp-Asp-Asp) domain-containing protein
MWFNKQERKVDGKYKKKERDIFLLWGEYPKGWAMVKDLILCLFLINGLIGHLKQVDIVALMASETREYVQEDIILPARAAEPVVEEKKAVDVKMGVFSAYNSEEGQTDSDPFTMASGKRVHDGAIANNCLAFGTKVKVGEKTYTVEDRMNSRYDCDHYDIWMEGHSEAVKFGRKSLEYQIIK